MILGQWLIASKLNELYGNDIYRAGMLYLVISSLIQGEAGFIVCLYLPGFVNI